MNKEDSEIKQVIITIIQLLILAFNVYVFIRYLQKDTSLFTIAGILNLIDIFLFSGGKGIGILIPLTIGSYIVFKEIWFSICFATIIDTVLCCFLSIPVYMLTFASLFKKDKEWVDLYESKKFIKGWNNTTGIT